MRYITNVEIKARIDNPNMIREIIRKYADRSKGVDHQVDTHFRVRDGRLKLREGEIESRLIFYRREDACGPKRADLKVLHLQATEELKRRLLNDLELISVVDKRRDIYYVGNVRFHIDHIEALGDYVEIEAQDERNERTEEELLEQCRYYMNLLGIEEADLVAGSYADMMRDIRSGGQMP